MLGSVEEDGALSDYGHYFIFLETNMFVGTYTTTYLE